jgi:hypothetical protein
MGWPPPSCVVVVVPDVVVVGVVAVVELPVYSVVVVVVVVVVDGVGLPPFSASARVLSRPLVAPQNPWKSSVSMDQTMTPPRPSFKTYSDLTLRLSSSS